MHVVLAGGSGLIGSALRASLRADGHQVTRLVRRLPTGPDEVQWWPGQRPLDPAVLTGATAVVGLSGAGIGEHRLTARHRTLLTDSRVEPTRTLAEAIAARGSDAPPVFVSASAIGYYGDCADALLDESAPPGTGFLAELCGQWEAATAPAQSGTRVVRIRTGLVLSRSGGLLDRLRRLVRWGVAGRLGSGRQWQSWITLSDEVAAIRFLLDPSLSGTIQGPVNLVGPAPVRQAEFINELGRILHRPTVLPAPRFALRLVLGSFADEGVLASQRVHPAVLTLNGFSFTHTTLAEALSWATSRTPSP